VQLADRIHAAGTPYPCAARAKSLLAPEETRTAPPAPGARVRERGGMGRGGGNGGARRGLVGERGGVSVRGK
jgi:hypothetical protein